MSGHKKKTTKGTRAGGTKHPSRTGGKEAKVVVVQAPAAKGITLRGNRPKFTGGVDRIMIQHRELIGTVVSDSTDWKERYSIPLNPGNSDNFPWLSTVAWSWESYRWRSLRFVFEPRCGTTTAGAVQMFPDYDWSDGSPSSEVVASSFTGFQESNPWNRAHISLSPSGMAQSKPLKYVVPPTDVPDSADPTNYYSGKFYLYTVGTPNATLGSLWVEYDVELIYPTAGIGETLSLARSSSCLFNEPSQSVVTWPPGYYDLFYTNQVLWGETQDNVQQVESKARKWFEVTDTGDIKFFGPGNYIITFSSQLYASVLWVNCNSPAEIFGVLSEGITFQQQNGPDVVSANVNSWSCVVTAAVAGAFIRLADTSLRPTMEVVGASNHLFPQFIGFSITYCGLPSLGILDKESKTAQPQRIRFPEGSPEWKKAEKAGFKNLKYVPVQRPSRVSPELRDFAPTLK